MERFADEIDLAQIHIDHATEHAVANIVKQIREGEGREECEECGAVISAARLAHVPNATRCVPCQAKHERTRMF